MKELLKKAVSQFGLLSKGDIVTVALSGGADSVALLHSLYSLRDELGITVKAAHLNHLIRGEEAFRDEAFVRDLCENLGIELVCEQIDVPRYAKENSLSLELAARQLRYDFLNRVCEGKIATAHTASDNLETVLFNLTRGTALKGLCGIPAMRGNIIRPLIFATRQDIEDYCKDFSLQYVTDSSNLSDDYTRNKIRHNVIPVLKELNSSVEETVIRTCLSLNETNSFLEKTANEILFRFINDNSLSLGFVSETDSAIAKALIKKYFTLCFPNVLLESVHLNKIYDLCKIGTGKVNLPSNLFAIIKDGVLRFETDQTELNHNFKVNLSKSTIVNNLFSNNLIDCDKIVGELIVRTRQEGDSIRLNNRGCTKSLKKLFTENKIDLNMRENLPVIADEKGVIWVHKIGVAQRVAVTDKTKNAYSVEVLEI